MITGTYNLIADPSWALAQFQEVRLECNTALGPVTINLPAISTLAQSTNLKLFVVDATANASVNNITINAGTTGLPPVSDTFDDSTTNQIILDSDGSSVIFQNVAETQWIATESVSGGSTGYEDILYTDLYDKIINKQLTPNGKYRLLDYKSVNFLNGFTLADSNPTATDPNFNPRQIHTGSNEVLLLEAISDYQLNPNCISENYPQDNIEFQAYTNKIGVSIQIANGQPLPDSTIVSGFDLQWDGTNVYFNMPANYPALFGHYFRLYAEFNNGNDLLNTTYQPLTPIISEAQIVLPSNVFTTISVNSIGVKVILNDLIEQDYLNYDSNTLYVSTIYEIGDAYGCITRRNDTQLNINVPFDFRARTYRRFEVNLSSLNSNLGTNFYGQGDNFLNKGTTGNFKDYLSIPNDKGVWDIYWNGIGSYDGYSYSSCDNNVFNGSFFNCQISNMNVFDNTFIGGFYENVVNNSFFKNTMKQCGRNKFFGYIIENLTGDGFLNNQIYDSFQGNNCNYAFQYNRINLNFNYNITDANCFVNIFNDSVQECKLGQFFRYNTIQISIASLDLRFSNYLGQNYPCNVLKGSNGTLYLSYYSGVGVNQTYITPITA